MNTSSQTPKTPGVYTLESTAFPPSIIGVETAVPIFIGYTEKATINGKDAVLTPVRIDSLSDYETIFGKGPIREYDVVQVTAHNEIEQGRYDCASSDPATSTLNYYRLVPATSCRFYLYNSLRLFYANGGNSAYIVSVGDYSGGGTQPQGCGVERDTLLKGLAVAAEQSGPTIIVVPDAISLPTDDGGVAWRSQDFASVVQGMLAQGDQKQDRFAILDVYGTEYAGTSNLEDIISVFHEAVGGKGLSYGASYFPFLQTTVITQEEISYMDIAPNSRELFRTILTQLNAAINNNGLIPPQGEKGSAAYEQTQGWIGQMWSGTENVQQTNANLLNALPPLGNMEGSIRQQENVLPPSGAMAGVYTSVDMNQGVWRAPANVRLTSVTAPTFAVNNVIQGELNVPLDGKAVNCIRSFPGRGPLVWGARTLDGNSNDWRYIQVRRTIIYIEQSIKTALGQFVFAANDGQTWATVTSMISNFLQGVWSQGGLMGATASEAFSVQCGLGSTMTPQDILEGYMIVQVTLQMIRPAEFIELTFKQKMEGV